jgi:phospholipase C
MVGIKSFPERLEENNISWKVYQNELVPARWFQNRRRGSLAFQFW